ncbi:GNAT family N-acetyltransferase [Neisseria sp. Ec49-e6-T10]|uniref:GNAT family N-acetyltransferase n=1 Tax=Neisseria sp. Ec49-e6-T10 TaxID=3140744 RepID=UPI003EB90C6D
MMIEPFKIADIDEIATIWLETNIQAHAFIPAIYWEAQYPFVKEALKNAVVFIYRHPPHIQGFIGLIDNHIAGLFVSTNYQSQGIGTCLLEYTKKLHPVLTLDCYADNTKTLSFYQKHGFRITEEKIDADTRKQEYHMVWEK